MTTFWLCLPLLAVGFVAGIVISLLQIVTSIQDPGFGTVPRLAAFLGATLIFLPWVTSMIAAGFAFQLLFANDGGLFNLQIDGATAAGGANEACGGSTDVVVTSIGTHTVGETAGTSTSLANYATPVIGGDCATNGTITLAAGDVKVCTITNARLPRLTVTKICAPTSDAGRFNLRIDGATAAGGADEVCGGSTDVIVTTVGTHTVSETAGTGTSLANYGTPAIGGDCASNGTSLTRSRKGGNTISTTFRRK